MVKLANNSPSPINPASVNDIASLNDFFPLAPAVWAALEKIGGKQKKHECLAGGAKHNVQLNICGSVDGQAFQQSIASIISIGYQQNRASSVNPQVPELVAYILSKLNTATRNRLLTDIPADFRDNDNQLPCAGPVLQDEAKHMLKQLRQSKTVTARGAVRCEYALEARN